VSIIAELGRRAGDSDLPFIVVGGNAVIAYGYPRQTQDFDLLVREMDRRAWHELITSLGYFAHHAHRVFHMYAPSASSQPPIDLMLVDTRTFERLNNDAREIEVNSFPVRIPSLPHLIALKLHAIRHGGEDRRAVDLTDIVELVRLNHVNLASRDYQEILERYASAKTRSDLAILVPGSFRPESADS
jgi:predicted nucleotidyltransferase